MRMLLASAMATMLVGGCAGAAHDIADGETDTFLSGKADDLAAALGPAEIAGVLRVANESTLAELDDEAGLDARAARNIFDARPLADLPALDAVPYVGPVALGKLLDHAVARGFVEDAGGGAAPACVIISEVAEGQGNYNKAIEILNCGGAPVALERVGVCLVRDGATSCGLSATLGAGSLAAGDVRVVCRSKAGTLNDPMANLRDACDLERAGVMTFSGDDRLVLFWDADGSGAWSAADAPLDALGRFGYRPWDSPWADKVLRRCRLEPWDPRGGFYQHTDWFTEHQRHDYTHLGVAPAASVSCP